MCLSGEGQGGGGGTQGLGLGARWRWHRALGESRGCWSRGLSVEGGGADYLRFVGHVELGQLAVTLAGVRGQHACSCFWEGARGEGEAGVTKESFRSAGWVVGAVGAVGVVRACVYGTLNGGSSPSPSQVSEASMP